MGSTILLLLFYVLAKLSLLNLLLSLQSLNLRTRQSKTALPGSKYGYRIFKGLFIKIWPQHISKH